MPPHPPCTSSWALPLSLLDLSYATTTVPQMLIHLVSKVKLLSLTLGVWSRCTFLTLGITETWIFAAMAYDRYICHMLPTPLWGQDEPNPCVLLAVSSALCGLTCALVYTVFAMNLPTVAPMRSTTSFVWFLLSWSWLVQIHPSMTKWTLSWLYICSLIPLSFILASYVRIFTAILKIRSTQGQIKAFSTCAYTSLWSPCFVFHAWSCIWGLAPKPPQRMTRSWLCSTMSFLPSSTPSSTASGTRMWRAFFKLVGMSEDTQ